MTGQLSNNQPFPVLITLKEPQVLITVAGPICLFPFRHQENFLGAHYSPSSALLPILYHNGAIWMSQMLLFRLSSKLQLELCAIFSGVSHFFCTEIYWAKSRLLFSWIWNLLFLIEQNVKPEVWADGKTVGRSQNATPVIIKLNYPHLFPHQKQYPLKPEVKEELKPITENLKEQGLLILIVYATLLFWV